MAQEEFDTWKKEREKDKILDLINEKGTVDVAQVSEFLEKPFKQAYLIIRELVEEKLVKSDIGDFYHLTFEGYKRVRSRAARRPTP